jgi:hypothetical protein
LWPMYAAMSGITVSGHARGSNRTVTPVRTIECMITTYTLLLAIGDASLRALTDARARLVIAKTAANRVPNVVWLVLSPKAATTVRWDETCGIFAAEAAAGNGNALRIIDSVHPAMDRRVYPFYGSAFGEPADAPRVPQRHYDVRNASPVTSSFGLLQDATVDGTSRRSPVNAVALPPGFIADFTLGSNLYLWVQAADVAEGVAPEVPDNATIVALEREHPAMAYRFDDETAAFVRAASEAAP